MSAGHQPELSQRLEYAVHEADHAAAAVAVSIVLVVVMPHTRVVIVIIGGTSCARLCYAGGLGRIRV